MSGRPRLVQEGEPISLSIGKRSLGDGGCDYSSGRRHGNSSTATRTSTGNAHHTVTPAVTDRRPSTTSTLDAGGGGSSLQRAVRNSLAKDPQHQRSSLGSHGGRVAATTKAATSFVIGSSSSDAARIGPLPTKVDERPKSSGWSQQQPATVSAVRNQHFVIVPSIGDQHSVDHCHDTIMDHDTPYDHSDHNQHLHGSSSDMEAEPIHEVLPHNGMHSHAATMSGTHGQMISSGTSYVGAVAARQAAATRTQTACVIRAAHHDSPLPLLPAVPTAEYDDRPVDRMEGVEDLVTKLPLVVQDGSNVAIDHASAMSAMHASSSLTAATVENKRDQYDDRPVDRMEGVEDLGTKLPLVVLDGANVAYAYAAAMSAMHASPSLAASTVKSKREPDAQGIKVATDYFLQAGLRVLVVLPQYWFMNKGRPRSAYGFASSQMQPSQLEILKELKARGLVVVSPPTDDDDAYALTIAQREESRSLKLRQGEGPGFVLSNDLFRDAQDRHGGNTTLKRWLKEGRHKSVGPGRISYTFGDMGTMNDRGERILDFVPNPRHPLIVWMETNNIVDGYACG